MQIVIFSPSTLSILCAKVAVSILMECAGISTGSVTLLNVKLTFTSYKEQTGAAVMGMKNG